MRVTTDDRCRLQSRDLLKPNTPYDGEKSADGRVVFVELVPVQPANKMTKEQVLKALDKSPLRFTASWDELKQETR